MSASAGRPRIFDGTCSPRHLSPVKRVLILLQCPGSRVCRSCLSSSAHAFTSVHRRRQATVMSLGPSSELMGISALRCLTGYPVHWSSTPSRWCDRHRALTPGTQVPTDFLVGHASELRSRSSTPVENATLGGIVRKLRRRNGKPPTVFYASVRRELLSEQHLLHMVGLMDGPSHVAWTLNM